MQNTLNLQQVFAPLGLSPPAIAASKGNYGVHWGNTDFGQGVLPDSYFTPSLHFLSAFGLNSNGSGPSLVTVASVTDGLSNTVFMSEILQGASDDIRGTLWVDNPGAGSFMSRFTPNGYRDYAAVTAPWSTSIPATSFQGDYFDNLPTFGASAPGTSPAQPGSLCDSQPVQSLGCYSQGADGGCFSGARSRHPGGVNTLFGDGSVRFMKSSVNAMTWVALGSIRGGEVISADAY